MNSTRARQHGMALVMVVTTLAVASVLAMTMLSSSALQAQMASSVPRIAQAEYLAESGVHWGIAKLKESAGSDEFNSPLAANPARLGMTYGPLTLRTTGQCTVTITRQTDWDTFLIESAATFTNPAGKNLAQARSEAVVKVTGELKYTHGAVIGTNASLNSPTGALTFDTLAVKGTLNLANGNNVSNRAWATGFGTTTTFKLPLSRRSTFITSSNLTVPMHGNDVRPRASHVRTFEKYVWKDGKVYNAVALPVTAGVCSNATLGATASNPAGVYRHDGNLRLGSNVRINGTLVVEDGHLTLDGPGSNDLSGNYAVEIDATGSHSRRFPALVVPDGGIYFSSAALNNRVLRVKGVTYVGGVLGTNTLASVTPTLRFEGTVILPTAGPATRGSITFDDAADTAVGNTDVPLLDRTLEYDRVEIRSWKSVTQ